jgi:hypothetical protein
MVVKASLAKLKMSEAPTTLSPDGRTRAPHLKTWRDGWRHLRFLLLHSPKWLFIYPGLALMVAGITGAAALAQGSVHITPTVELDIHTLAAACFAIIIGSQMLLFGFVARRYAAAEGILPPPRAGGDLLGALNLERLLQIALVLVGAGLVGACWAFSYWTSVHFGAIEYNFVLRALLLSLTTIVVGVQTAASAFLASVFNLRN